MWNVAELITQLLRDLAVNIVGGLAGRFHPVARLLVDAQQLLFSGDRLLLIARIVRDLVRRPALFREVHRVKCAHHSV